MAMKAPKRPNIGELFDQVTPITQAVQQAAREALLRHKLLGNPVADWQDGRVVIIPPEQIVVPDLQPSGPSKDQDAA
jgi:hypothetical protein